MMQWIPDRHRVNEVRLRYIEKAYRRGFQMGVATTAAIFCVVIAIGCALK